MLAKIRLIIFNAILSLIPFLIGFYFSIAFLISQPTGLEEIVLETFSIQNAVFAIGVFALGVMKRNTWRNRLILLNLLFLFLHFIFGSYIYPKMDAVKKMEYKLFRYNKHKTQARAVLKCRDGYELILTKVEERPNEGKVAHIILYPEDKGLGSFPLDKIYRGQFVASSYQDPETQSALETCRDGKLDYKQLIEILKSDL